MDKHMDNVDKPAPIVTTKDLFVDASLPRKIQQICFEVQTPQEIVKCGVFPAFERALYKMPERAPHPNGVLDRRLGVSGKVAVCETCGNKLAECAGHFAYIKLELPVFHIGYFKNTLQLLQCICKNCSRVLLPDEERRQWIKRFRNPRLERVQREMLFKKVLDRCKRTKLCPYCGEFNLTVKKTTGALKIIHDKFSKSPNLLEQYKDTMVEALRYNEQIRQHVHNVADDLHPLRVQSLFQHIPDEDCDVLDITGRPENLIVTHIAVPPVAIRPSVEMDGASNEDDITMKLMQIIEVNNVLRLGLESGLPVSNLMENWDFLQIQCAMLINSDMPGVPPSLQTTGRPLRGYVQRLKGKTGRFRGNLSGKRVDFSGRTVISPDPNLHVNQVCVPRHMAVILTYPERVTHHNIEKLRQRVLNGVNVWPGANFLISPEGDKTFLKYGDRRKVAADLKVGHIVERHLDEGDVVLFNRQPSLHRISIMAFKAKVRPGRTLRFNECCCSPFNADFDGDEMNLHLPQTEEARAEALHLMGSVSNLTTPKNGEIMISATQDFLTFAYLITSKDRFLTRSEFTLLASYMADAVENIDMPTPAVLKPMELWTGKQLVSILIRPNLRTRIFLNLEIPEKIYSKKGEHMCPVDGYVAIRNSEHICGRLGKVVLGGSKGGLFGTLHHDYSSMAAAECMVRLAKTAARYMGVCGFSIGIDDVTPREPLLSIKNETIKKNYGECDDIITQYKEGSLELQPGCNMDQTLEASVMGILNNIREIAGKVCMDNLQRHNAPLIMSQCGSKGSPINIAQMVACVGQQSVGGKRAFNGFKDRTLPHYPRGDKTPAGKGFVANSFYSGLTATEFWFHTMGGREGLVDTAVKTAETGYMSRRLMKALEDLYTHYDLTVRNASSGMVQFKYGDDGMDPVCMEGKGPNPLDFSKLLSKVRATTKRLRVSDGGQVEVPLPSDLAKLVDTKLKCSQLTELDNNGAVRWCSTSFKDELSKFCTDLVDKYRKARERVGISEGERDENGALEYAAGLEGVTPNQLDAFVALCMSKYEAKRIDPGSTVGAIGAQSIGEPGTQMTLKTFHFAGVASMNVTLGVPRIKEIINGARNISTPIMKVALNIDNDVKAARIVKGRLERTTLGEVAHHIKAVFKPGGPGTGQSHGSASISIRLDMNTIESLQLGLDGHMVKHAILNHPRIKLKEEHVRAMAEDKVVVYPPDTGRQQMLFTMEALLSVLPKVVVVGIPTAARAVISKDGKNEKYTLLVEGTNLQAAMATGGVDGTQTVTNHVWEIEKFLGIEAARATIMSEINNVMGSHGMSIDARHTMLLADCMTYKGEVLGITRFGIAKMKDSVLHTASFEKTADHLFDAAIHGRIDDVVGVSESIIMGMPMPVGTGLFKLRHNVPHQTSTTMRPPPLLSYATSTSVSAPS